MDDVGPMHAFSRNHRVSDSRDMWKHVPEKWKNSELQEQPHATVQRWINSLAPGVAHHAMRTYRAVLRAAWYDDLLTDEPFKKPFRYPRKKASKLDVWSAYEVSQSIEKLRGDSLYGIFLCMAGAGLRREEGLALNWEDIDFIPFEQDEKGNVLHWMARIKVFDAFTELDGEKATNFTLFSALEEILFIESHQFGSMIRKKVNAAWPGITLIAQSGQTMQTR